MSDVTPTLAQVLGLAGGGERDDMRVALPARVEAYDSARQCVTIQLLIKDVDVDEEGERLAVTISPIVDVPVAFPGSGSFSITWPIAVGDTGIALFASSSIDKWLDRGGLVDPLDERHHALSDAMFIPGVRDFRHPVPAEGVHGTAMVIAAPAEIHVGGSAALAFASELNALRAKYHSHTHLDPVSGSTGGPSFPEPTNYPGTTKLKGS